MGVDIRELVTHKTVTFDDLANKPLAFDAFNIIYQFLASVRQADGTPLMDSNGNVTSHLSGLFYRNTKFLEAGIKPIYVFDGKPPQFKRTELIERQMRKEKAEKELEKAAELEKWKEVKKLAKQTIRLTDAMIEESKELLRAMGIPIVQAPSEGEAQAAYMAANGYAYASVSQDYDSLLFGAPRLIRNLSITGKRHHVRGGIIEIKPEEVILDDVLKTLGITRKQLIWLGILIGTDFNEGVKGIGPKKGLKIVKECKSIDDVIRIVYEKKGYEFIEDVKSIEQFFLNPPKTNKFKTEWREINKEKIIKILVDAHNFSYDRIMSTIEKLNRIQTEINKQTGLAEFM
ncbi:flap endonuclease-1 [Candidatus Micrarchaeota archaeon]|nr:flap endonuclease-1 [Candidatus Micrarchaeota archaeon]